MKYSLIATSAFALALSATVCATTVLSSPEDNATEIANTFNRSMLNAMKIGTQNALATYYTKDAIVRGVTGDNAYGLQEIGKYWTEAGSNTAMNRPVSTAIRSRRWVCGRPSTKWMACVASAAETLSAS